MSDPPIICTLRARRLDAGLSQSALAERVGVSRQALIHIEAGRQIPSTGLALLLARALRCGVDDLFALPSPAAMRVTLAPGGPERATRVVVGQVDGRWAAHQVPDGPIPSDGLLDPLADRGPDDHRQPRAVAVQPLTDPAALAHNALVAGCAPLLGLLAGRLGQRQRHPALRATWIPANSARAVDLLAAGLVHVAGLHLEGSEHDHRLLVADRFPGQPTLLVHLTRWRQGLVVAPGNPLGIRAAADVTRPDVRFARREPGAGADALIRRLLGAPPPEAGPLAAGHAEVARLVRWGVADVGVAIEAAALAAGLDFVPLAEERFDLVVPRARAEQDPVARLLGLLDAPGFRAEAGRLPGYDLDRAGHAETVGP